MRYHLTYRATLLKRDPLDGMNSSLVIDKRPNRLATFECATGVGIMVLAQPWQATHLAFQRWLLLGVGAFLLAAGIEFLGRRVIIEGTSIHERLWFHWRTHELSHRVFVGRDARSRVAVGEVSSGRILFRCVREFGSPTKLEQQLSQFFRIAGHLD